MDGSYSTPRGHARDPMEVAGVRWGGEVFSGIPDLPVCPASPAIPEVPEPTASPETPVSPEPPASPVSPAFPEIALRGAATHRNGEMPLQLNVGGWPLQNLQSYGLYFARNASTSRRVGIPARPPSFRHLSAETADAKRMHSIGSRVSR